MADPVVEGRSGAINNTASATHPITLPAGIVAGEMLVVAATCDGYALVNISSGPQWHKISPQMSNGTAVTGAIFWKIAGEGASDDLTLKTEDPVDTPQTRTSSHVSLRISGAKEIFGAAANGSSANSDPPNVSTGLASQLLLIVATRHGDADVAATVVPAGMGWLTNRTGSAAGVSTSTAELTTTQAAYNPATFTSLAEQWVCWTLAILTQKAEQSLVATYDTYNSVEASLVPIYSVLAPAPGGNAWFLRLTDGYATWMTLGASSLTAQNDYSPQWQVKSAVQADLSPSYTVAIDAVETGVIDGTVTLPFGAVEVSFTCTYALLQGVSQDRSATWQVRAAVENSLTPTYTVNGVITSDLLVIYTVAEPVTNDFSALWEVFGIIGAVENNLTVTYDMLASASQTFAATWQIFDVTTQPTVYNEYTTTYSVRSSVTQDLQSAWDVLSSTQVERDLLIFYGVRGAVQADFADGWSIALDPVVVDFAPVYDVRGAVDREIAPIWQIVIAPIVDVTAVYDIEGGAELAANQVDVYRYGTVEVAR